MKWTKEDVATKPNNGGGRDVVACCMYIVWEERMNRRFLE